MALLCLAVAACTDAGGSKPPAPSSSSAHAGIGEPSATASIAVRDVDEVFFQTPSKNIVCDLSPSAVRCDIIRKSWTAPPQPSSCDLDWGSSVHIAAGKAGFTCAGDTLIGSGTEPSAETLAYGQADRSGSVRCTSESSGLTCLDEKTGRGFTLSVSSYVLF